ncbi:fibro-slime domain-containing protein [Sorangium sp. So ce1036]|uniref:fibro-slime domain-containing protein n=1 Tax=Sorangium sp. So ce1036 TaxID=3133328 RepID=UPI003F0A480A
MTKTVGCMAALALTGLLSACSASSDTNESSGGTSGGSSARSSGATGGPGGTTGSGDDLGFGTIDPNSGIGGGDGAGGGPRDGQGEGVSCDGKYTGRVRDFYEMFPDMEPSQAGKCDRCDDHEIVTDTLGPDLKPVYAGGPEGTRTTTGKENFDQWFRDVEGVNAGMDYTLQFEDPDRDGVWTYNNQEFFPIDGELFGNEGRPHNYHFTFELHMGFVYNGGEQFTFAGDDDVFTYINGKKVVDLGGIHAEQTEVVDLDTLGLEVGQKYQLDFFFAERHVTDSHFRIDTSIKFVDCGIQVR